MLHYLIRRLLMTIPILVGISLVSFAIMYVAPGQPAILDLDPSISVEARARQIEALGLNQPAHVQYGRWLGSVVTGDLGTSFTRRVPVTGMILERLPNTLLLMVASCQGPTGHPVRRAVRLQRLINATGSHTEFLTDPRTAVAAASAALSTCDAAVACLA